MKVKVTRRGVYDAKNERIEIGKVLTIKGDEVPGYLVGKCEVIEEAKAKKAPAKKAAVTNPAQDAGQNSTNTNGENA